MLKPFCCSCGRTHNCDIKHIYIGHGAVSKLREMCEGYKNILIVADENTYAAAGEKCTEALVNKNLCFQIFSGKTLLVPDEEAVKAVENKLSGSELIIAVGSGVIQDISKYISHFHKIPYFVVATAPSMDGYASSGAAMIMGGMKITYPAKVPDGFIGDTEILKNAPLEMIKSGYGDIMGKYSSLCDWKLANLLCGDYFCGEVAQIINDMLCKVRPLAKRLLLRDEKAIEILTESLITVGIALAYVGNSQPASGSEHHLSHFFEITGLLNGEAYLPHGTDVLYSAYIMAKIHERLSCADFTVPLYKMDKTEFNSEMRRVYKSISDGCIALHEKTGLYKADRRDVYLKKEGDIKKLLADTPSAEEIEEIIRGIGLDVSELADVYGEAKIKNAVKYAKDLKERFTALWLYYDIFGAEILK